MVFVRSCRRARLPEHPAGVEPAHPAWRAGRLPLHHGCLCADHHLVKEPTRWPKEKGQGLVTPGLAARSSQREAGVNTAEGPRTTNRSSDCRDRLRKSDVPRDYRGGLSSYPQLAVGAAAGGRLTASLASTSLDPAAREWFACERGFFSRFLRLPNVPSGTDRAPQIRVTST